tara:strand:- start:35044 stop:35394 length:351 start_codon:yes stop_codon:yes gene_type:complete
MNTQHQIKQTLSAASSIESIQDLLKNEEIRHRTALATIICGQFDFYDARGQAQISSCLKALRDLEAAGHFSLPAAMGKQGKSKSPCRLPNRLPPLVDVPAQAREVQDLKLVLVQTS